MKEYPKGVDITSALLTGDVSIQNKLDTESNSDYNLIPQAIMITKNNAADDVEPITFRLRGGDASILLYLKINKIYELSIDKVFKTGTTTESIVLLGAIN